MCTVGCADDTGSPSQKRSRQMEGIANSNVQSITADGETSPVVSADDAADDPAVWINYNEPEKSFIIGTDKKAGLYVYDLDGKIVDFQKLGNENNVDLRQRLDGDGFDGHETLIAASNRTTMTVDILTINNMGRLKLLGTYPTDPEPYGLCVGLPSNKKSLRVLLNYKNGLVDIRDVNFENGVVSAMPVATLQIPGQTEGCAFDDDGQEFYIGQEDGGIWRFPMENPDNNGELQAGLNDETGLVEDVEGLDIYHSKEGRKVIVASSQGDFTYVAFEITEGALKPLRKFRIKDNPKNGVDGVQETDGVAVTSAYLNDRYPEGILVVQDGENEDGFQNFKIVDWRKIDAIFEN